MLKSLLQIANPFNHKFFNQINLETTLLITKLMMAPFFKRRSKVNFKSPTKVPILTMRIAKTLTFIASSSQKTMSSKKEVMKLNYHIEMMSPKRTF